LKRLCIFASLVALALTGAASEAAPSRIEFAEIWAYLMDGEERFLGASQPITDLVYFGAGLGTSGNLVGVPDRDKLPPFKGRVHLVVAEIGNYALTHFCLDPEYPLRDALIADIAKGAEAYDGVQIDFEAVGSKDYENFYAFLSLVKNAIGKKILSVALSAQTKETSDNLSYEKIGKIADRIIVMAYDEHWSASEPGPVASIEWCQKVSAYALSKVDADRIVMGAPFYGRAWADKSLSRAYKYSSLVKLIDEKQIANVQRQGDIPFMEYDELVNVKVFFDDFASILARLTMYRSASVRNIAFWRLGQEDPDVWGSIAVSTPPIAEASRPPYMLP
jgi:spore germination protein YaaH